MREVAMHPTAMKNCEMFFKAYGNSFPAKDQLKIIEIGSQDVNGSIRSAAPPEATYIGVDFARAKGVDVVLDDPYSLPFADNEADIVLTSSCLEHSELFWLSFLEMMRILKPSGLLYINAPSNGIIHKFPVDCWRFYPDSGHALVTWARRNQMNAALLESYVSNQSGGRLGTWNDFVAVFVKDEQFVAKYPKRILHSFTDFRNGAIYGKKEPLQFVNVTEDQAKAMFLLQRIENLYSESRRVSFD